MVRYVRDFFWTSTCFFFAFHCITIFIFFVGAKRLIADVVDDNLRVTYRALLRRTQVDICISEIGRFVLIDPKGDETDRASEIEPENRSPMGKFILEARFADRSPVILFKRSGALGHDVGQIMLAWWAEHGKEAGL